MHIFHNTAHRWSFIEKITIIQKFISLVFFINSRDSCIFPLSILYHIIEFYPILLSSTLLPVKNFMNTHYIFCFDRYSFWCLSYQFHFLYYISLFLTSLLFLSTESDQKEVMNNNVCFSYVNLCSFCNFVLFINNDRF